MSSPELPPRYYLEHFEYLLRFITNKCPHLLNNEERQFIERFQQLSCDARCLFVRLCNRKGQYFRVHKLHYPEIEELPEALAQLDSNAFVYRLNNVVSPLPVLNLFTRAELMELAQQQSIDIPAKPKKPALLKQLQEELDIDEWLRWLSQHDPVIEQGHAPELHMLRLMFFGSTNRDMSTFVISDLGHSQFETINVEELTPAFESRQALEDKLAISQARYFFYQWHTQLTPVQIFNWFRAWLPNKSTVFESKVQSSLDHLLLQVGRFLERANELSAALEIYRYTTLPPSRERQVRLLHKTGENEAAQSLCEQIKTAPLSPEERIFAEDFIARLLKRRHKAVTLHLKEADSLSLEVPADITVEKAVLEHYCANGWHGFFSENHVWRSLLGILCWPLIFDAKTRALHHPFQRAPSNWAHYLRKRETEVKRQFSLLDDEAAFIEHVEEIYMKKFGISNPLVNWYEGLQGHIMSFRYVLTPTQLKTALWRIAQDPTVYGQGLPDLLIWSSAKEYTFIEVKSATDVLSAKQLDWLKFFEANGINAKVLKIIPPKRQNF